MNAKKRLRVFSFVIAAAALFSLIGAVQQADAILALPPGPIDPNTGFPAFYTDTNGLGLGQCLDPVNCVVLDALGNPFPLPIVFPDNFPDEFFYWIAEPDFGANANVKQIRFALEAAFATALPAGAPQAGQQIVFQRKRFRVEGFTGGATITIDHPYGTERITDGDPLQDPDGLADGIINITTDEPAGVPLDFVGPINSNLIGPFLTGVTPPSPAGFIGGFNVGSQTVANGRVRNNITITGGGLNLTTNLWFVAGQVFVAPPPKVTGATFSRSPVGAGTIDVLATNVIGNTVDVVSDDAANPFPNQPVTMTRVPNTADFSVSIPLAATGTVPASVTITVDRAVPPGPTTVVIPNLRVTDKIVGAGDIAFPSAIFDAGALTLTVRGDSSNQRPPLPVLTVTNAAGGVLGTIDHATETLTLPAAASPGTVTITSAKATGAVDPAGGTATISVATIPAPAAPVPPGGLPAGAVGGGGGGGGCFIDSIIGR